MKINIYNLAGALFFPAPHYLDLADGSIVSASLIKEGTADIRRPMLLPNYSLSPVYQQYLDKLFSENDIADEYGLRNYPRFEMHTYTSAEEWYEKYSEEERYIDDAYHFLYDLRLDGRTYDDDCFAEIAYYQDFEEQFRISFARQWCAENGFEWYQPEYRFDWIIKEDLL